MSSLDSILLCKLWELRWGEEDVDGFSWEFWFTPISSYVFMGSA
jgi:hypothetical protein